MVTFRHSEIANDLVLNQHNKALVLEQAENSRDQCMIGSRFSSSQCEGFQEYPVPMNDWSPSVVHFPWGANTSCQNLQSVPLSQTPTRAAAQEESALQGQAKTDFFYFYYHLKPTPTWSQTHRRWQLSCGTVSQSVSLSPGKKKNLGNKIYSKLQQ